MRILYFFDADDKYGAPQTGMELISKLKSKYSIEPVVLTTKKNNVNKICDELGIENYVTRHQKFVFVQNKSIKSKLKYIPRYIRYKLGNIISKFILERKIDFTKVDLIHTNISGIDIGVIMAKKHKIPNIVHLREFGDLDFNMKSYRKNYIDFFNNNVTCFIAISDAIKKHWIKKGIDKNKIHTIYNGVNTQNIIKKENYDIKDKKLKIIIMGSISRGKGQQELVEAISKINISLLENISVDIVGGGFQEEVNMLKKKIKISKLEKYIHLKEYDRDIKKKIHNYDIGVVCSNAEGFGRVTIEYMAAGLNVIASNTGANPEIIKDNYDGLLYKKGNAKDLAEKIEYLYENFKIRKEISKNAIKKADTIFNNEIYTKNIYNFYKNLI